MKVIRKNMVAMALFIAALAVLLTGIKPFAHPGQPAYTLAQKLGLDPIPVFASPVYAWVVKAIAAVTGHHAILFVNAFSAVCGAGVLALVFLFVYRFVRLYNADKHYAPAVMHRIQLFCGLAAVLYLFAAVPFLMAATRANAITFDILLLLSAFYLALSVAKDNHPARLPLATLLYGICIVEFSTAILLAPLFGVLLLAKLWIIGSFNGRSMARLLGAGLIGLSLYLIQAGLFMATPAYAWREFSGFGEVLWFIWVEQYIGLTKTLPRVGWLSLGMVSLLPWLLTSSLRLSRQSHRKIGAVYGITVLNAILGVLAVLLLIDGFPLAPATLTGTSRLFVTPYVIIALWVGNLVAFWLVELFRERRFERPLAKRLRRAWGMVLVAAIPAYLVGTMAVRSLPAIFDEETRTIQRFVEQVVEVTGDRDWLLTNTPFDDQISLEAFRRGRDLKVLRMTYGRSPVYMKYIATLFEDQPRLQSLAGIGLAPLLDEWFLAAPDIEKRVAVLHVPDVWLIAGMEAVPDRVLFSGSRIGTEYDYGALVERNRAFWDAFAFPADDSAAASDDQSATAWIRTHLSKMANNLGVFLEDHDRSEDAYACYIKARELAPHNLSALMNQHVLANRLGLPEFEELEQELIKRTADLAGRVQTWTLSYVYGFVRVPELFVNRGMAFAMSGKANMAIADMKRALTLRENNPAVQMALASLYFAQEKDVESRDFYLQVLAAHPDNQEALLGLMRIAVRNGELEDAREHLARLKELGYDATALKMEEAVLESFDGNPARAMTLLDDVVARDPNNLKAWAAIAVTAAQLKETRRAEEAIAKLREAKVLSPNIQLVMAQSELDQQDRDGARRHLGEILRRQPGNIRALEMMARIYLSEGNRDMVQETVEKILTHEPSNAFGNYLLGVHHYFNEEYALAESAYRASLASRRTPETLNDLAYVLYLQDQVTEAESLIRESLGLNENNSSAWDTLGVILMKQGRLDEAEQALLRSLSMRPEAASVTLSLAILYEKQGKVAQVVELLKQVTARINELPPSDQNKLRELQQRLDDRR